MTPAGLPFLKFFPTDWRADAGVQVCSLAARGLWFEMLCLMHDSPRRGELLAPGGLTPLSTQGLARLVGGGLAEVETLVNELRANGVFSEVEGVIVCRKMVRDEAKRRQGVADGRKGGNPALKGSGRLTPPVNPGVKGSDNPQSPESRVQSPEERHPPTPHRGE